MKIHTLMFTLLNGGEAVSAEVCDSSVEDEYFSLSKAILTRYTFQRGCDLLRTKSKRIDKEAMGVEVYLSFCRAGVPLCMYNTMQHVG